MKRVILMRNTTKLLPILLLGSALSGCSMAGLSSPFSNDYSQSQHAQTAQYEGASSYCQPQQVGHQQTTCSNAYTSAQHQAPTYPYSAPAAAHTQPTYAQTANYQAYTGQQANQGHPAYQGQQAYQGQSVYQAQPAYPVQQGYAQNGYGVPPYLNPRGGDLRGLRQSYTYGTLGATLYDVDSDVYGVQGRAGWQSKSFYGAEVEGSFGINDDDDTFDFGTGPVETKTEVDTQIAAFAVGRYPITNKLNILGRVGYHNTEFTTEFDDGVTELEDDFSEDGIAYGVGAEYAFDPKTSLRADYTRYDFDGADADALSLAIARKF